MRTAAALALKVPQAEGVLIGMQEKGYANFPEEKEIEEKALQIEETYGYSPFSTSESNSFFLFLVIEIFLTAGLCACIFFSRSFYHRKREEHHQEALKILLDNIHAYTLGDYETSHFLIEDEPELEQLQKELDKMGTAMFRLTRRLEEEEQNTKTLISDISHQLKTPLAALKINYELQE